MWLSAILSQKHECKTSNLLRRGFIYINIKWWWQWLYTFLSSIGLAKKFLLSFSVWWYGKTQTNFLANPVFEHERKIATELNCLSLPSALLLSPLSGKYLANLFFQEPRVVTGPLLRVPDLATLPVSVCLSFWQQQLRLNLHNPLLLTSLLSQQNIP